MTKKSRYVIGFLLIVIILGAGKYKDLSERSYSQELLINDYKDALGEANKNIEELNYQIWDAQGEAWESYGEMGEALENLYSIEQVDNPERFSRF